MKIELEVDVEEIDNIVVESLKNSIDIMKDEIIEYHSYDTLPLPHKIEDYKRSKKIIKFLIKTHNYYTSKTEHLNYKTIMNDLKKGTINV